MDLGVPTAKETQKFCFSVKYFVDSNLLAGAGLPMSHISK